jgi:hypothetical protein
MNLILVGAGQLGSAFILELLKRISATGFTAITIHIYDDDIVEDRNTHVQYFTPRDREKPKAVVMADLAAEYGIKAIAHVERFAFPDLQAMENVVVVDAVDNVSTRYALWNYAVTQNVPLMTMGNSLKGNGFVTWTCAAFDHNTWGLGAGSYTAIMNAIEKEKEPEEKVPPCELTKYRGLALNTALAACEAFLIYWGQDVMIRIDPEVYQAGFVTEWRIKPEGYELVHISYMEGK